MGIFFSISTFWKPDSSEQSGEVDRTPLRKKSNAPGSVLQRESRMDSQPDDDLDNFEPGDESAPKEGKNVKSKPAVVQTRPKVSKKKYAPEDFLYYNDGPRDKQVKQPMPKKIKEVQTGPKVSKNKHAPEEFLYYNLGDNDGPGEEPMQKKIKEVQTGPKVSLKKPHHHEEYLYDLENEDVPKKKIKDAKSRPGKCL